MALRGSRGDVQRTHPWDLCLARVYLDSGPGTVLPMAICSLELGTCEMSQAGCDIWL